MKSRTLAKLKRICKDKNVTLIEYPYFCRIIANDYDSYLAATIPFYKMTGVRVLRNYYVLTIDVYEINDFRHCQEIVTQKRLLIHLFYIAMRNTADQSYAKQQQIDYVKEHPEYQEAYNEIYK